MRDMTGSSGRIIGASIALIALLAVPAGAQNHRNAFSFGGGWSQPGDITPGFPSSHTLEAGWVAGGQLEGWTASGRAGIRFGASYVERALVEVPTNRYQSLTTELSLLVRLLRADRGRWVAPYIVLGAGSVGYLAGEGAPPMGGIYGDDGVIRAVAVVGGGLDLMPYRYFGFRVEAVDQIVVPGIGERLEGTTGFPTVHGPQVMMYAQVRGAPVRTDPPRVVAAVPVAPRAVVTQPQPQPAAQPASPPQPAAVAQPAVAQRSAADTDELRSRMDAWQRELVILAERVDSLEQVIADVRFRAAAAPPAAPAGLPAAAASRAVDPGTPLYTAQVAAFVEESTAYLWQSRLRQWNVPVWVTPAVVKGMRVTRVRVGALPSQEEAEDLARFLTRRYGWPVWVDRVSDATQLPGDAIGATRTFLSSN